MESQEVLETNMAFHCTDGVNDLNVCTLCGNRFVSEQVAIGEKHSDNLNVDLLEDLDTMMEDIDNRLRISRMVSDSVIKGTVSAVEQEADEKIKAKELEIASLKRSLQFLRVNGDENELSWLQEIHEPETVDSKGYVNFEDACVKHDKMKELSLVLRKSATDQFKRLKKQIEGVRGCKVKRNGSYTEMVGLGGILKEKEYESWVNIDKTVDSLETMINKISRQVDSMLIFSKTALCEWQQEYELKAELEDMVMQSSIRCFPEEFKERWIQKASRCGGKNVVWAEKLNEISGLRNELDALTRLLPSSESGHLLSHGSFDTDNSPGKPLISQMSSRWDENGKSDESKHDVPESFDDVKLKHLTKEGLFSFFNNMISKMKREHESIVQEMTENYISLKGKYLSERRSVLPHSKDLEILRRKISELISKLDNIHFENDNFPGRGNNVRSLDDLKNTLDTLLSENRQLKDSLEDKKNEVKCLLSELSIASEKMSQHTLCATNFQKLTKNHKSCMADTRIEASIVEDVYKCVLGEQSVQIQCMKEESEQEIVFMHEIYGVLLGGVETSNMCAIEDTCMELLFMQGLLDTIFKETLIDVKQNFDSFYKEYLTANEDLVSLETEAMEREVELLLEIEEKERLRSEMHSLRKLGEENERLARELAREREQNELASNELSNLRKQMSWLETLLSKTNKELDDIRGNLLKAEEKLELDKLERSTLNQKLELAMEEIKTADDCKKKILAVSQEKQCFMSMFESKEREHRKQMEAIVVLVDELSTKLADFECRVAVDILKNNTRLENLSSQLSSLIKAANGLKRTGFEYKQKLERKCSDLQMAEDEVDLLGDEVETLLSLLEKIYVALDHYSPVLQHYPGVTEILKLVRRELSGESVKVH